MNKNKTSWRPSRAEMRESFLLHVKVLKLICIYSSYVHELLHESDFYSLQSYDDIRVQIAKRKAKLKQWNLNLQPFAVMVGPTTDSILQRYIVIDEHFYSVESSLKAIDVTFKSFQALQAVYPPESERTWLFLQRAVYDIGTKYDKQFADAKAMAEKFKLTYPFDALDHEDLQEDEA